MSKMQGFAAQLISKSATEYCELAGIGAEPRQKHVSKSKSLPEVQGLTQVCRYEGGILPVY